MFIRNLVFAACFSLAAAPLAAAQTAPQPDPDPALSFAELEQRFAADGFRVLEIERYPNVVEVKGFDRGGFCVELYLDPRTGEVLRRERDDDCGARGGDRHGRRGGRH